MDDTRAPTGRELEILKYLWDHGPSNVRTVYKYLLDEQPEGKDLAYNTVQTLLRLMEAKALVRSRPASSGHGVPLEMYKFFVANANNIDRDTVSRLALHPHAAGRGVRRRPPQLMG